MQQFTDEWNWDLVRQRCLREARRHTVSEADAQDAVQDAMLLAWRFRDRCRDARDPIPWALTITRREAWRQGRGRSSELELDTVCGGEPARDDIAEPLAAALDVRAAIAGLGESDRELLRLRYVEDLPQPVVAERLGIPEGTAKVRLHRVRARLRELMTL